MKHEFSEQIFEKYLNIKFNENTSSWNRVVLRGLIDMTKLIVVFAILRIRLKSWEAINFSGMIFLRSVNIKHVRHNSNAL